MSDEVSADSISVNIGIHEQVDHPKLPVTLLSGFLGSGKTTLLKHILQSNEHKLKIAVIVNDMAELNVDAALVEGANVVQTKQELIAMQNGCICCTLRGDLIREISRIYHLNRFDYIIIESTGIAEPMQVAESFCASMHPGNGEVKLPDSDDEMLWNIARLDTCVTVIDCREFLSFSLSNESFADRFAKEVDENDPGEGGKNISQLLIEQVEFANVIIVNKIDLVSSNEREELIRLLQKLNPKAILLTTSFSKVDLKEVINTKLFNLDDARQSAGWLLSLQGDMPHTPETLEYGITSFVYRARRPFHPKRLLEWANRVFVLEQEWSIRNKIKPVLEALSTNSFAEARKATTLAAMERYGTILRSKGFCWIAGRDKVMGVWATSGQILTINVMRPWLCELSEEQWQFVKEDERMFLCKDFVEPYGDRRQEVVFIGSKLQVEAITTDLNECLLSDDELALHDSPEGMMWDDPLPPWNASLEEGKSWLLSVIRGIMQSEGITMNLRDILLKKDPVTGDTNLELVMDKEDL